MKQKNETKETLHFHDRETRLSNFINILLRLFLIVQIQKDLKY